MGWHRIAALRAIAGLLWGDLVVRSAFTGPRIRVLSLWDCHRPTFYLLFRVSNPSLSCSGPSQEARDGGQKCQPKMACLQVSFEVQGLSPCASRVEVVGGLVRMEWGFRAELLPYEPKLL